MDVRLRHQCPRPQPQRRLRDDQLVRERGGRDLRGKHLALPDREPQGQGPAAPQDPGAVGQQPEAVASDPRLRAEQLRRVGAGVAGRQERLTLADHPRESPHVATMPARVRLQRMLPSIASVALVVFVMLVLFGPIVLLAVLSFDKATIIALDWQGFTTQWYREMWANTDLRAAVLNSMVVAAVVTVISMVAGRMAACAIPRFGLPGRARPRGRACPCGSRGPCPLVFRFALLRSPRVLVLLVINKPQSSPISFYL